MQKLNGFCRTADLSGVQRTPKTSKQQPGQPGKAQERSSLFLLLFSSSSCILELNKVLKGRMSQTSARRALCPQLGAREGDTMSFHTNSCCCYCNTQIHGLLLNNTTPLLIFLHTMQRFEFPSPRAELDLTSVPQPLW